MGGFDCLAILCDRGYVFSLRALFAFSNFVAHCLSLLKGSVAFLLDLREVNENILSIFSGNKSITFFRIEPFYSSVDHPILLKSPGNKSEISVHVMPWYIGMLLHFIAVRKQKIKKNKHFQIIMQIFMNSRIKTIILGSY